MNNIHTWRDDKPTDAQMRAIQNMSRGFNISPITVHTKGEACDELNRLQSLIADIKLHKRRYYGINPAITNDYDIHFDLGLCGQ